MSQAPTPAATAAGALGSAPVAAAAASFRHVQTLSDDEDYFVSGAAVTDSDTDTEELMGRVDWSMANNSDDCDVPPGPPAHSNPPPARQLESPAAVAAAAASHAGPSATAAASITDFPPEPVNKEDWMFDFSRPSVLTAAVAASSRTSGPVNPAQLSQADAAAQQAAAAERLSRLEAANAAAAAARAAAALRAAAHATADKASTEVLTADRRCQQQEDTAVGGQTAEVSHPSAAAGSSDAVWDQLAAVEEEEERQQQQQRRQLQTHDPRNLPEDLHERLDLLLAGFQAAVNPRPLNHGAAAAHASDPAAAPDRVLQGLQHGHLDEDDDYLPAERVVHTAASSGLGSSVGFANCLPPIQNDFVLEYSDGPSRLTAATAEHAPAAAAAAAAAVPHRPASAAALWDRETDDHVDESLFLSAERVDHGGTDVTRRRVGFSNCLPPIQDDFDLEFTDGPTRRRPGSSHRQHQQPQGQPPTAALPSPAGTAAGHPGMHPAAAAAAAAAVEAAAVLEVAAAGSGSSSRSAGMVPVLGGYTAAAMDDMFSISKRPRTNISSSTGRALHSGMPAVAMSNMTAGIPGVAQQHGTNSSNNAVQQQQQQPSHPGRGAEAQVAAPQPPAADAYAGSSSSVAPVLGRLTAAGMDDMFSFRKSGSGSSSGSRSVSKSTSSSIRHPYM